MLTGKSYITLGVAIFLNYILSHFLPHFSRYEELWGKHASLSHVSLLV